MADPLAIIGALAACYELASLISSNIKSYAKADADIAILADKLDNDVIVLNHFLDFFRVHNEYFRSRNEDGHLDRVVDNLRARLQKTARKVEKLANAGPLDKIRWLGIRSDVITTEGEIYQWSQRFSARLATLPDSMKQELVRSVQKESLTIDESPVAGLAALLKMKQSVAFAARSDETALLRLEKPELLTPNPTLGTQGYHIEYLNVPTSAETNPARLKEIKLEVAKLTDTLQGAGPSQIHILEAYGFFETGTRETPFGIAYCLPGGLEELTNLHKLLEQKPRHPLEARLQLAISISTAVAYLHAMSFVHKSIRSSNILMTYSTLFSPGPTTANLTSSLDQSSALQSAEGPQIGTPYLAGFSYARRGTARSTGSSRADWRNEIYRHPERQGAELGIDPEVYYKPYHDVYSLGVVLLELGLWEHLDTTYEAQLKRATAHQRRDRLIDLASGYLPLKVGSTFSRIVRECLEVDADTDGGEDQMTVQKVLEGFEEIRL